MKQLIFYTRTPVNMHILHTVLSNICNDAGKEDLFINNQELLELVIIDIII